MIAKVYQDDCLYQAMVKASRAAYDERLNWDAWGIAVTDLIAQLLGDENLEASATGARGRRVGGQGMLGAP